MSIIVEVHLGRRIAYARKKNKLTQTDFAKKIHVSSSHLGNIETGKYQASNEIILLMSQNMDVPISYFLNWDKVNEVTGEVIELLFQSILNNDLEEAKQLLKSLKHPIECIQQEITKNMLQAVYYIKKGKINKALEIEEEYLSVFLPISNIDEESPEFQLYYYYYLMQNSFIKEEYEKSYTFGQKMLDFWKSDTPEIVHLYINLSNISMQLELYHESLNHIKGALDYLEVFKNDKLYFIAYIQLSAIYIATKQYDKALTIVDKLNQLTNQDNSLEIKSIAFQHIGTIYLKHELFQQAISYFEKSQKLGAHLPIETIHSMITCYIKLGNYLKAKECLEVGENYMTTECNYMIILAQKAELFLLEGNEKMSWKIQRKTIQYFIKNKHFDHLSYIYKFLAKHYFKEKRYKESATYFMELERLKDEEKQFKISNPNPVLTANFHINT